MTGFFASTKTKSIKIDTIKEIHAQVIKEKKIPYFIAAGLPLVSVKEEEQIGLFGKLPLSPLLTADPFTFEGLLLNYNQQKGTDAAYVELNDTQLLQLIGIVRKFLFSWLADKGCYTSP